MDSSEKREVELVLALVHSSGIPLQGDVELSPKVCELIRKFGVESTHVYGAARERDVQRTELFSLIWVYVKLIGRDVLPIEVIAALHDYCARGNLRGTWKSIDTARRKLETLE